MTAAAPLTKMAKLVIIVLSKFVSSIDGNKCIDRIMWNLVEIVHQTVLKGAEGSVPI